MRSWSWKAGLAGLAIVAAAAVALAQTGQRQPDMHGPAGTGGPSHMMGHMMAGHMHGAGMGGQPTMAGQDAFGTIQEVMRLLEADPSTDWSKVNIKALREHLIDMNEVALRAVAEERALSNGIEIAITGEGRTLEAIKRMVPAHAHELEQTGWNAKTEELPNGVKLVVTSAEAQQAVKLKALGFMGIMVQGSHHQPHHLLIAKGEFAH
jgi:hypothetical protein